MDHNKKANLNYVKSAADSIVPYLEKENLVILESTVPPGTTENILKPLLNTNYIAYCPERVLPGRILVLVALTKSLQCARKKCMRVLLKVIFL